MTTRKMTSVPLDLTENDFEDYLITDKLLVDYFNAFLSLPCFPNPVRFNRETGIFEIVDDSQKDLKLQIKALMRSQTPMNPIYNVTRQSTGKPPPVNKKPTADELKIPTNFIVKCLNQEQGISWIKNERLPAFLQSECYFEYRLGKLLSQLECATDSVLPRIDRTFQPWALEKVEVAPDPFPGYQAQIASKHIYVCYGEAPTTTTDMVVTEASVSQTLITVQSVTVSLSTEDNTSYGSDAPSHFSIESSILHSAFAAYQTSKPSVLVKTKVEEVCNFENSRPKVMDDDTYACVYEDILDISGTVFHIPTSEICDEEEEKPEENKPEEKKEEEKIKEEKAEAKKTVTIEGETVEDEREDVKGEEEKEKAASNVKEKAASNVKEKAASNVKETAKDSKTNVPVGQTAAQLDQPGFSDDLDELSESDSEEHDENGPCYFKQRHGYNLKNRRGVEKFKQFLEGTAGEKYFRLWIDIERLRVIKHAKAKQSQVNKLRNRYLFNGGEYHMNAEILSRLGLSYASLWTEENLFNAQPDIVEPLLLYWGPRFCIKQKVPAIHAAIPLKNWEERQLRPKVNVGPFPETAVTFPIRPKITCPSELQSSSSEKQHESVKYTSTKKKRSLKSSKVQRPIKCSQDVRFNPFLHELPNTTDTDLPAAMSIWAQVEQTETQDMRRTMQEQQNDKVMRNAQYKEAMCSKKMESLLQTLYHDSKAGYFFTQFCGESQQAIWKNAADLWFELQEYHRLFYANNFQPFKLRRQAQFIYASYIFEKADSDVEVDEDIKTDIYHKLEPPFEELFDFAEEYILTLLLIPWMAMVDAELSTYRKVAQFSELRNLDSAYCKTLQQLQQKFLPPQDLSLQLCVKSSIKTFDDAIDVNHWKNVAEEFQNYTLNMLFRNRIELGNFQQFLSEHFVGMDLKCWLDIEQFRRISHQDKEMRNWKSKEIKKNYLNRKYFFGPGSPASAIEQDEVMKLAGGWGNLLHEQLSSEVLVEVQRLVKNRLEKKWLPLFLATPEFVQRQHKQIQIQDVVEDRMIRKRTKKAKQMKIPLSKWIFSSKEIIEFRKALLNPITALQFKHFVSLKGGFLENNMLFWLEVQKYKSLHHSHADKQTIDNKIKTIIDCFINSKIQPSVQIDITEAQALNIINQSEQNGPYIFREAQIAIFAILFALWPDFIIFRGNVIDQVKSATSETSEVKRAKDETLKKAGEEEAEILSSETNNILRNLDTESVHIEPVLQPSMKGGSSLNLFPFLKRKVSWSLSKYFEAIEREKQLIQREKMMQTKPHAALPSASTGAVSVNDYTTEVVSTQRSKSAPVMSSTEASIVGPFH